MMNDKNQLNKIAMRKDLFNVLFVDPKNNIDAMSIEFFLDLVNDISLTKDLAKGEVDLTSFCPGDTNVLNRMYRVGSILNKEEKTSKQMAFVYGYIDSCCVDLAKSYYEIGLVEFKDRVEKVINTLYEDVDFYDAVLGTSNSLDSIMEHHDEKRTKALKKTVH